MIALKRRVGGGFTGGRRERLFFVALGLGGSLLAPTVGDLEAAVLPRSAGNGSEGWRARPGEPGSGQRRDEPGVPGIDRLRTPQRRRPRSAEEAEGIAQMEAMMVRFRAAIEATDHSIRNVLAIEGQKGRKLLERHYDHEIREHQAKARVLRSKAIARYEDFLKLHPDDPNWTPEIMFRLAELSFERADERFRRQEEAWEEQIAALQDKTDAGEDAAEPPPAPVVDYQKSVELFGGVVRGFPRYAHNDAALYMMGVLLYESEDYETSRQSFLALACNNRFEVPDAARSNLNSHAFAAGDYEECVPMREGSQYLAEAWLRTGEGHYDVNEFKPALEAYAAATQDRDHKLYSAALIRLAWTHYLIGNFPAAADGFDEYIRYADSVKNSEKAVGAAEYREDAIKYLAMTYLEEDWDRDGATDHAVGVRRLDENYAKRQQEPHVPELYAALGDQFAFTTDYRAAIEIWNLALRRWPTAAKAPMIQHRVLQAYESLQDPGGARSARDALATNYLRGTPWFFANEHDTEALEAAMELAEDALVATALDHHERAQGMRIAGKVEEAKVEYAIAAKAYEAYLERFPETKASYEYRYQFGDAQYYSDQFLEAAKTYAQVRDSNINDIFQVPAADSVVAALEEYVAREGAAGRFSMPDLPRLDDNGDPPPVEPIEMPILARVLQEAYDRHVAVSSEDAPSMMFRAGAISQRYRVFEDAEARFAAILERHCDSEVSVNAGNAIIDSYVVRGDLNSTREWSEKLSEMECGGEKSDQFMGALKKIVTGVKFEEANVLFEAGDFEAAADRYVALVNEDPDDRNADRALNNAAVAYENIGRFSSASATYRRIYTTYELCPPKGEDQLELTASSTPGSPGASDDTKANHGESASSGRRCSEFADDALLRTGYNHARFFEFEEAVQSYLVLAETQPYEHSEHRLIALENAAGLLDNLQQYQRSAELYRKTAAKAETEEARAEAIFNAARVLSKAGDHRETVRAFKNFLDLYSGQAEQAERVVEAWLRLGLAYRAQKSRKRAEEAFRNTVSVFADRGLEFATEAADLPAEAQFALAEYALADVTSTTLAGKGRNFEKNVKKIFERLVIAAAEFDKVFPYRRIEWVLAAMYQRAYGFEYFATNMRRAPVPTALKEGTESYYAYKDLVAKEMEPFEIKSVGLYQEVLVRSKQFNISNEWTKRAGERLNVYLPDQFPLLRDPALDLAVEDRR